MVDFKTTNDDDDDGATEKQRWNEKDDGWVLRKWMTVENLFIAGKLIVHASWLSCGFVDVRTRAGMRLPSGGVSKSFEVNRTIQGKFGILKCKILNFELSDNDGTEK
jgi:hypothetical protein